MDYNLVLEILEIVGLLIVGGLGLYFKHSAKAQKKAKEVQEVIDNITANAVIFIREAEERYKDTTNMGGTKFEEVVDRLYDLDPEALKYIITRDMIADIVQSTFNQIEEYVKLQIDNAIDNVK